MQIHVYERQHFYDQHLMHSNHCTGVTEGVTDQGRPRREFLQLLVDSPLFTGLEHAKHTSAVNQCTLC